MRLNGEEFKSRVIDILLAKNNELRESGFRLSEEQSGYYLVYRPLYPNESPADFIVHMDLNGCVSVHGNLQAMVPTIEKFENLGDFEKHL